MNERITNVLGWLLDRLGEQSTWKGIIGLLTAAGAVIEPTQAVKIMAIGIGVIGLINGFRNEAKSTEKVVQRVLEKSNGNGGTK